MTTAKKSPIIFLSSHRPRFSELDPYGHLNTKHYFDYIAENRMIGHEEMLGITLSDFAKLPFAIITANISIDFKRSVQYGQTVEIKSWVDSVSTQSAVVKSEITIKDIGVAAIGHLTLVNLDKSTGKPAPWDENFLNRFFEE